MVILIKCEDNKSLVKSTQFTIGNLRVPVFSNCSLTSEPTALFDTIEPKFTVLETKKEQFKIAPTFLLPSFTSQKVVRIVLSAASVTRLGD